MSKTKNRRQPYNLRSRTTMNAIFSKSIVKTLCTIMTLATVMANPTLKQAGSHGLKLGKLYDCSNRRMITALGNPSIVYCGHLKNVTRSLTANIYEFEQKTKSIPIYHCYAEKHGLWCEVGFFGSKRHWSVHTRVSVSKRECEIAHSQSTTNYGPLVRIKYDRYRTTNKLTFECPWPRTTVKYVMEFELRVYKAKITAGEPVLIQSLTASHCQVKERSCTPKEWEESMIIWDRPPILPPIYHNLGRHKIFITNDVVTVPSISVGGVILKEDEDEIALDSSFIIKKRNISLSDMPLYEEILIADKELRSERQVEHSMSGVARVMVILMRQVQNLEKLSCRAQTR